MSAFSDVELLQDFLTEAGDLLEDVDSKLVEARKMPICWPLFSGVFTPSRVVPVFWKQHTWWSCATKQKTCLTCCVPRSLFLMLK